MKFTGEEIEIIRKHYPTLGSRMVTMLSNHPPKAVITKAEDLGIKVVCSEIQYTIDRDNSIALAMAIDCEGTILLRLWEKPNGVYYYHPKVSIYNTNYKLIEWAAQVVSPLPNYISQRDRPEKHRQKKWKNQYQVDVRGVGPVYSLLRQIAPFLKLKTEQAELLLEFCGTRINKPIRQSYTKRDDEIYNRLKIINKRGPPTV